MLSLLSQYSRNRTAWFLLFISTLFLEIMALYFQHGMGLAPCTLCIYQRCAIFGIMIASLFALISPGNLFFRLIAIFLWLFCAFKGFQLALFHAHLQFEPNLIDTCTINVVFPTWLPLNTLIPSLFNAYGLCAEKIWTFLTIEMSQWMIIIFAGYLILGLLVLISQFVAPRKKSLWSN